jgi:hypothetical protein
MGSNCPICMNQVLPDSLWCQESYILLSNVFYAQNDYFWSFLGFGWKMPVRIWLLCAEYLAKYEHFSIHLWCSRTCCIDRISERYHLSRLSNFWWGYGDVSVVSVGVLNGHFDIGPLKWVWYSPNSFLRRRNLSRRVYWWLIHLLTINIDWVMTD